MSRVQLALNVDDLDEAITFYSKLFNTAPAKVKQGYANFAVAEPPLKLVLLENPGKGGTINHLGVEVDSSEKVHAEIARLSNEGFFTDEEIGTTCRFATQDKVWVTGPEARSGRSTQSLRTRTRSAKALSILKTTAPGRVACAAAGTLPTPQRRKSATPAADHTTSDTGVGGTRFRRPRSSFTERSLGP